MVTAARKLPEEKRGNAHESAAVSDYTKLNPSNVTREEHPFLHGLFRELGLIEAAKRSIRDEFPNLSQITNVDLPKTGNRSSRALQIATGPATQSGTWIPKELDEKVTAFEKAYDVLKGLAESGREDDKRQAISGFEPAEKASRGLANEFWKLGERKLAARWMERADEITALSAKTVLSLLGD